MLKALEILKVIGKEDLFREFMNKNNGCLGKIINEAIEELEQYEQKFKQKEFKYRTECQNTLSTERVESDNMTDKLAELEKLILDYYLAKGYKVGVGDWGFEVDIYSRHKFKNLTVLFSDQLGSRTAFTTTTRISSELCKSCSFSYSIIINARFINCCITI